MYSIYTSFFNVEKMGFDWRGAIKNWHEFLAGYGEIVIAVNTSVDDSYNIVKKFCEDLRRKNPISHVSFNILSTNFDYSDPEFDGKIKNAALKQCKQRYGILLDCDERIDPKTREVWDKAMLKLEYNNFIDALLIPVIDLYHDERNYKSVGFKWYLHKITPNICRGVVKWAYRDDGSIDISKSDTCELKYEDTGELVKSQPVLMTTLPHFIQMGQIYSGTTPYVFHYGWLDKKQRIKQDEFWGPVWRLRDRSDKKTEKTLEELNQVQYYRHNLPRILRE